MPRQEDGTITPPGSIRGAAGTPKHSLRIDPAVVAATGRREWGCADTPVGTQAEVYKFYCPLCMMFYRSVLELPCCNQSTCAHCFGEYVTKKAPQLVRYTERGVAERAAGVASAERWGTASSHCIPAGVSCPQCNVMHTKVSAPLKLIEGAMETQISYVESPSTKAHLQRITSGDELSSPLKPGDDARAMVRKMVPFERMFSDGDDSPSSTWSSAAKRAQVVPHVV